MAFDTSEMVDNGFAALFDEYFDVAAIDLFVFLLTRVECVDGAAYCDSVILVECVDGAVKHDSLTLVVCVDGSV